MVEFVELLLSGTIDKRRNVAHLACRNALFFLKGNPEILFFKEIYILFVAGKKTPLIFMEQNLLFPPFGLERKTAGIWTNEAFIDIAGIEGSVWRILGLSSMPCWWCGCLVWGFPWIWIKNDTEKLLENKANNLFLVVDYPKFQAKFRSFWGFKWNKIPVTCWNVFFPPWRETMKLTKILMIVEVWGVYVPWRFLFFISGGSDREFGVNCIADFSLLKKRRKGVSLSFTTQNTGGFQRMQKSYDMYGKFWVIYLLLVVHCLGWCDRS